MRGGHHPAAPRADCSVKVVEPFAAPRRIVVLNGSGIIVTPDRSSSRLSSVVASTSQHRHSFCSIFKRYLFRGKLRETHHCMAAGNGDWHGGGDNGSSRWEGAAPRVDGVDGKRLREWRQLRTMGGSVGGRRISWSAAGARRKWC